MLRDDVVLDLPFRPLCRDDCPGLCPVCGARLADDPGHHHAEELDPRWSALLSMTDKPPATYNEPRPDRDEEVSR